MTNPLVLSTVIDDQTINVTVPPATVTVTPGNGVPVFTTVVDDQSVAATVTPAAVVNVSTFTPPFTIVTLAGPAGAPGPPGPAFTGTAWWEGTGPPDTIIGSKGGDYYIDVTNGTIYVLQ